MKLKFAEFATVHENFIPVPYLIKSLPVSNRGLRLHHASQDFLKCTKYSNVSTVCTNVTYNIGFLKKFSPHLFTIL